MTLSTRTLAGLAGRENADRLKDAGIRDLAWLLRIARTPEGREQLAAHTGIHPEQLLTWAQYADLCRIPEVDCATASSLQKVGIQGVADLVAADSRSLSEALQHLDPERDFAPRTVSRWIRSARRLRPAVHRDAPPAGTAWEREAATGPLERIETLEGKRKAPRG